MFSKPLAFALLAVSCLTAAAGGAYIATRHNSAEVATTAPAPASAPMPTQASPASPAPVAETEATVTPSTPSTPAKAERDEAPASAPAPARRPTPRPEPPAGTRAARATTPQRTVPPPAHTVPAASTQPPQVTPPPAPVTTATVAQNLPEQKLDPPRPAEAQPEPPRVPQFEELVLPASSVIGLQVETALSSERARVEDRVDARVTRDVLVNGRVAIPAGSRVLGSVTMVDKGGKVKGTARLGIRFHTLVLADGSEVTLHTEPFYRDGESPAGDSTKKIGGAAVGGAILGAILGGGKGAMIGGAAGAGAGSAAVMASDRHAAVVAPGSIVTVHLSSPATIQVERRQE